MSFLKPKDETYVLPAIADPSDLFAYIAAYNDYPYYETDTTGVTPNEIPQGIFFIDRIDLAEPLRSEDRMRYTGVLFIGGPSEISVDTNSSTFNVGQFRNIVKHFLSKDFANDFTNYINCDFQILINSLRPLYNSVKYTKATNCTGVEIFYQIWI